MWCKNQFIRSSLLKKKPNIAMGISSNSNYCSVIPHILGKLRFDEKFAKSYNHFLKSFGPKEVRFGNSIYHLKHASQHAISA